MEVSEPSPRSAGSESPGVKSRNWHLCYELHSSQRLSERQQGWFRSPWKDRPSGRKYKERAWAQSSPLKTQTRWMKPVDPLSESLQNHPFAPQFLSRTLANPTLPSPAPEPPLWADPLQVPAGHTDESDVTFSIASCWKSGDHRTLRVFLHFFPFWYSREETITSNL